MDTEALVSRHRCFQGGPVTKSTHSLVVSAYETPVSALQMNDTGSHSQICAHAVAAPTCMGFPDTTDSVTVACIDPLGRFDAATITSFLPAVTAPAESGNASRSVMGA